MKYLNDEIQKIYFPETRDYFKLDVLSSFNNNSYRTCIISLWNVLLYDVEKKLDHVVKSLKDSSRANELQRLLNDFKENRRGRRNGEELKLLNKVQAETSLLLTHECDVVIQNLKQERNACAHPVVELGTLYSTNRHTVEGLLDQVLKILIRAPFDYQRHFEHIMADTLETFSMYSKNTFSDIDLNCFDKSEYRYMYNKYYKYLMPTQIHQLHDELWRKVIDVNDTTNNIRYFIALLHLIFINTDIIAEHIKSSCENFVDTIVTKINQVDKFDALIILLLRFKNIYGVCYSSQIFYDFIESKLKSSIANLQLIKIIFDPKFEESIRDGSLDSAQLALNLDPNYNISYPMYLLDAFESHCRRNAIIDDLSRITSAINKLCIQYYVKSRNYAQADDTFSRYIRPRIDEGNLDYHETIELVNACNQNHQAWGRGKTIHDHQLVLDYLKGWGIEENELFDLYNANQNFFRSTSLNGKF